VTLPLTLVSLDQLWPRRGLAEVAGPPRQWAEAIAGLAAAALALLPLLVLDPYRRIDLTGRRSGPYVLGLCRGTLRTASRLESGQTITWDPDSRRFAPGVDHPGQLDRMRWFLWEGWGSEAYFGSGDIVMQASRASILVPALQPQDLKLTVAADAPAQATLEARLNGAAVGEFGVGPAARELTLELPAALLYRGDNLLSFASATSGSSPSLRLLALRLRRSQM
jgi:hypothetical protein